jgi:hypothetical protein
LLSTFVVTTTVDSGDGSLRQAILDVNNDASNPGTDTIDFDIPGSGVQVIEPLTALPEIRNPVLIDGYSQPGSSPDTLAAGNNAKLMVEISGLATGNEVTTDCLSIYADGVTVRGLVINGFFPYDSCGIVIHGASGVSIQGNFIGTDPNGTRAVPNGVGILSVGNDDTIGIASQTPGDVAERNVISGNGAGVIIDYGGFNELVAGNLIGTDASGSMNLGNTVGVNIGEYANNNTIGGTTADLGNVIAFNHYGIGFVGATDNPIRGNAIYSNVNGSFEGTPLASGPALSAATSSDGVAIVQGSVSGLPNATFALDFFGNPPSNSGQYTQGEVYIGSLAVTTNSSGTGVFTASISYNSTAPIIAATAIDPTGDTSEFSNPIRVDDHAPLALASVGPSASVNEGATVTFDGTGSTDADGDPLTYAWNFGDGETATGPIVTHTFDAGVYTAMLTVNDGVGGVSTTSVGVTAELRSSPDPVDGRQRERSHRRHHSRPVLQSVRRRSIRLSVASSLEHQRRQRVGQR